MAKGADMGIHAPVLIAIALVAVVVGGISYLRTEITTLRHTRPHHGVDPGLVWLSLIPLLDLGWQFYLLHAVTKGVKGRYAALGRDPGDGGLALGLGKCVLYCVATVPYLAPGHGPERGSLPWVVASLANLAFLATWLVYWLRLARFNRVLAAAAGAVPQPTR